MKGRSYFLLIVFGMLTMGFVPNHLRKKYDAFESKIHQMLKNKYNVSITGSGGSQPDEIRGIMIKVDSDKCYTYEQAREVYVDAVEEIISLINSFREIRPYLHSYPIDECFVDFNITFNNASHHPEKKGLVHFVFRSKKGILVYTTLDREKMKHTTVHRELYADALKKVKGNQKDLLN